MSDLIIIGAGPIGLEAAIRAKRAGLDARVLEKGGLVDAIYRYPTYMTFFTTSERLEIGDHPLVTATDKPTRKEALAYYRKVAAAEALDVAPFHEVTAVRPDGDAFALDVRDVAPGADAGVRTLRARRVMVATGYFDTPNALDVPGEDLPHVTHAYDEAHRWFGRDVVIVGAGSSAADAALDLYRGGARVTMVHRGEAFKPSLKYWIRPNLENRVKEGSIAAHFRTTVRRIVPGAVHAERDGEALTLPADRVYLLTGYRATGDLLEGAGAKVDATTRVAELDAHYQTTVPGLYAIGSAGFGTRTSDVFIENGLVHARAAVAHAAATPVR